MGIGSGSDGDTVPLRLTQLHPAKLRLLSVPCSQDRSPPHALPGVDSQILHVVIVFLTISELIRWSWFKVFSCL